MTRPLLRQTRRLAQCSSSQGWADGMGEIPTVPNLLFTLGFQVTKISRSLRFSSTRLLLTAALVTSVHPIRIHAQAESGRVVGTVSDTTGAAIPKATVTLLNKRTGLTLAGISTANGELNIPAVPAGDYTATVSANGFQPQAQAITVTVTTSLTLTFILKPGETTATVEVTGAAALVDTSNATLGETIEGKQITELPLNGRNALNLALLTPGVTQGTRVEYGQDTVNRFSDSGGGALSVNGTRSQANNFILDGLDNNDGLQNIILFFPPVDATQEFKVTTSIAPAQYGRAGGALVISSIRSGSNQFHGSAFEFYRGNLLAANPNYRFLGADATPNPSYRHANFGGSVGGPIIKNKLFAFGDYQGTRIGSPDGTHFDTVPTALMRQGNFAELLDPALNGGSFDTTFPLCVPNASTLNENLAANSKGQIYDPQTCAPFAGNIIPTNRLNPGAVNYLNAFPLPTRTDRVLQNYFVQNSSTTKYNTFDVRLDWTASPTNLFFFRYSYDNSTSDNQSELPQQPGHPPLSANGAENYTHARGYDLGYTHTFSSQYVNDARIGYNRDNYGFAPSNNGVNVASELGFSPIAGLAATEGGPLIGGNGNEIEYTGDYGLFATPQNTYEVTDTLNINHGAHSLNVGGTFLRRQVEFFRPISGKGQFFFAGNGTDFTGYEVSEMLAGAADNYNIGAQTGYFANISQEDGLFAQDDWRATKRLTLNLGVRWDLLTWPYEAHNQQSTFDLTTGDVLEAGVGGIPKSIIKQDYTNFAPRLGFAYDLRGDGKSALHGGYGIFYFPDYGGISNQLGQQPPFGGNVTYFARNGYCLQFTGQTNKTNSPYSCGDATPATTVNLLPQPGFPNFDPSAPPQGLGGLAVNRDNKNSRIQEYNLQLEQQFGSRDVFTAAYVGSKADRLSTYYTYNTYAINTTTLPLPNAGGISYNDYNGSSNYNGLQLHFQHSASNLLATFSYTWSHALDNSVSAFGGTSPIILLYYNLKANYGNATADERHVYSSSFVYNFPFGSGQKFLGGASRPLDLLVGGWQLNNIVLLSTGQPVDISIQGSAAPGNRPDLIAPLRYPKQINTGYWVDPSSFSSAIPTITATDGTGNSIYTRVGTLGRNQVYGPGSRTTNLGVQKNLHVTENRFLELHIDAFNLFNTANFANPNNALGNPATFGRITSLSGEARQVQLAARFVF